MEELESMLVQWWEDKRPFGWDVQEHLESPVVNCTRKEIPLCMYAASLIGGIADEKEDLQGVYSSTTERGLLAKEADRNDRGWVSPLHRMR